MVACVPQLAHAVGWTAAILILDNLFKIRLNIGSKSSESSELSGYSKGETYKFVNLRSSSLCGVCSGRPPTFVEASFGNSIGQRRPIILSQCQTPYMDRARVSHYCPVAEPSRPPRVHISSSFHVLPVHHSPPTPQVILPSWYDDSHQLSWWPNSTNSANRMLQRPRLLTFPSLLRPPVLQSFSSATIEADALSHGHRIETATQVGHTINVQTVKSSWALQT
jgi:hypothetical protein